MNDNQERYWNPSEITHNIGANGQLTINNVSGDVEIRGVDGDEVRVVAHADGARSDALPLTVHKGNGSLTIDVEKRNAGLGQFGSWFGLNDGIEFEVSV